MPRRINLKKIKPQLVDFTTQPRIGNLEPLTKLALAQNEINANTFRDIEDRKPSEPITISEPEKEKVLPPEEKVGKFENLRDQATGFSDANLYLKDRMDTIYVNDLLEQGDIDGAQFILNRDLSPQEKAKFVEQQGSNIQSALSNLATGLTVNPPPNMEQEILDRLNVPKGIQNIRKADIPKLIEALDKLDVVVDKLHQPALGQREHTATTLLAPTIQIPIGKEEAIEQPEPIIFETPRTLGEPEQHQLPEPVASSSSSSSSSSGKEESKAAAEAIPTFTKSKLDKATTKKVDIATFLNTYYGTKYPTTDLALSNFTKKQLIDDLLQRQETRAAVSGTGISRQKQGKSTKFPTNDKIDVESAVRKLQISIGEVDAGNDSRMLKNQISALADYLGQHGFLTQKEVLDINRKYVANI